MTTDKTKKRHSEGLDMTHETDFIYILMRLQPTKQLKEMNNAE